VPVGFLEQPSKIRPQPLHKLMARIPPDISAGGLLTRTALWNLAVWAKSAVLRFRSQNKYNTSRPDNTLGEQGFLGRARHYDQKLPRYFLLLEYEEYREDLKELRDGDPISEQRDSGCTEIGGISAHEYERDNLFMLFDLCRDKNSTQLHRVRGLSMDKHGKDAVGRSVFNLVPYKDEGGREYISRFLFAELHPVRMLMRSKGLNLMGFADKMEIARAKLPKSFFTDSIMKPWNLAKMKELWPETDLCQLRQDFHIWKATDWEADPVLFAATAMQVFVEHEEKLLAKKKKKKRM